VVIVVALLLVLQRREGRDAKPLSGTPLRVLERGEFHFELGDYIVAQAGKADKTVRGHTLIYESQLPGWVYALDRRELAKATEEHIRRLVGHWAGRVAVWDVVNEPITERGGLKRTPFERKLGPGHIATAFRIAQRADPKAKLHINETGAEGIGPKSDRLYELVRDLRARGVPIDGVGFQVHTTLGGLPSTFVDNLRRFAALGVEIAITEADVSIKLPPSAADLRAQARVRRHRARLPGDQGVPLADALGLHRRALVDLRAAAGLRRGDDPG